MNKIWRRSLSLLLLVRLIRRMVLAIERGIQLYEADLRERQCPHCGWGNSVIIPDPKLAGSKEAKVEITYGSQEGEPDQVSSFKEWFG
jgi:hypothetical protein